MCSIALVGIVAATDNGIEPSVSDRMNDFISTQSTGTHSLAGLSMSCSCSATPTPRQSRTDVPSVERDRHYSNILKLHMLAGGSFDNQDNAIPGQVSIRNSKRRNLWSLITKETRWKRKRTNSRNSWEWCNQFIDFVLYELCHVYSCYPCVL